MVNAVGKIVDYWTGKPIVGATILLGTQTLATTNSSGEYQISQIAPSIYQLTILHRDYERTVRTVDLRSTLPSGVETLTIEDIRVKPIFKAL